MTDSSKVNEKALFPNFSNQVYFLRYFVRGKFLI